MTHNTKCSSLNADVNEDFMAELTALLLVFTFFYFRSKINLTIIFQKKGKLYLIFPHLKQQHYTVILRRTTLFGYMTRDWITWKLPDSIFGRFASFIKADDLEPILSKNESIYCLLSKLTLVELEYKEEEEGKIIPGLFFPPFNSQLWTGDTWSNQIKFLKSLSSIK